MNGFKKAKHCNLIKGGGPIIMPLMFRTADASEGGGASPDNAESDELKAIEKVAQQVDNFTKMLGDKVNKAEVEAVKKELTELKEGLNELSAKRMTELMESINKKCESMWKQIEELQEEKAKDKEKSDTGTLRHRELVNRKEVEAFIKATFGEDGTKTQNTARLEINYKAAEDFGYPNFFNGGAAGVAIDAFTGREVDPTLYQRRRKRNLILDNFPIPIISVPKLIYLEKLEVGDANPVAGDPGGAEWIMCGTPKPQRSFRVTTGEAEAKKVAIYGRVDDCLLKDVASLENWIREDFTDEMREKINDGLLNNDPAVNDLAPLGLKTNAIQYTPTPAYTATIDNPNLIDDIIAVIALFAFNKEEAGKIFISSDNWYRIHHLKATDGKWLNNSLVYVNNLGQLFISGVEIVKADEEDVPSTHILAIGMDPGWKVRAYGSMVFERGLNGTDFREDKTSYRGYQQFLTYLPENRENSVLYDTIANIEAAIAEPVAP